MTGRLSEMRGADITSVRAENLVDIGSISIDASLPANQRMERYLEQIGNPYCFVCEDTPVKVSFASEGKPLDAKLLDYFVGLKSR